MKQLRELVYYSFFAGLMFYGFIEMIFEHRLYTATGFILFFSLDTWKSLKIYDKINHPTLNSF
jgi:hypothetical protein